MSDRIAVMRDGTIAAILDRAGVTPERILALALTPATPRMVNG
jgi:ABC-type sugar transport system ATPase subunit